MFEQFQCANSLYCFQACMEGVKNTGKGRMYNHDVAFNTQYDFNHTTKIPFMKATHLYELNKREFTPK